ncbi:MAG: hypothetical protein Tsb0020_46890 [Haliangiales bacterium]
MARAQNSRSQLAVAFEPSTYGTPPVAGDNAYWKVPFVSFGLGDEQPLLESDLLGFGRDPLAPVLDVVTNEGDVVVPIDAENFGIWLTGAFGAPTTTGTDPYTHVFDSGAFTLPSMVLEAGRPDITRFVRNKGARVNTLGWQMSRGGLLTATVGMIAQGEMAATTATEAGTLTTLNRIRFAQAQGSVQREGTDVANVTAASPTYTNNLDPIPTIRSDGLIENVDPAIAAMTGQLTLRFDDGPLIGQALAGAPAAMTFGFDSGTESITVELPAVYLSRPRLPIEGPNGQEITVDFQAAQPANGDPMVTVTLVNHTASYI